MARPEAARAQKSTQLLDVGATSSDDDSPYKKLQPGPGLSSKQVLAHQRARLCGAMLVLAADRGFRNVTVRSLTARAGVSTRAFYQCFANAEACFGATYSRVVRDLLARATELPGGGEPGVRSCGRALLTALAENPDAARIVLVESQFAGPAARKESREAVSAFERLITDGFSIEPNPVAPPPRVARAIAGAAIWVARSRLQGRSDHLDDVADEFVDWMLTMRDRRVECLPVIDRFRAGTAVPPPSPSREPIGEDRGFLLTAAAKLSAAEGYDSLTVPRIRREAGVSRRSFDTNFRGVAECFLEAVESRTNAVVRRAESEAKQAGSWERALVRIVASLCAGVAQDPGFARLAFLEILAPGPEGLVKSEQIVAYWAERLRRTVPTGRRPDPFFTEASVAAIWSMTQCEVLSGRGHRIGETIAEMAFVLLAPLLGPDAALRVICSELAGPLMDR
jgi:AcrR family transcriptional regulator